jgi:putative membrane-bound dehydrogenase-like protein
MRHKDQSWNLSEQTMQPTNSAHRLSTILVLSVLSATGTIIYQSNAADTSSNSKGSFPKLINTENPEAKLTTAAEALAGMKVPDGFTISLFASEPDINQPIALATDDRGRLWVAENYTYAKRETNFDDNMRDRVVILEDNNDDGKFDKRTEFWDQGRRLTSVEIGYGGVWVLDAPNLLFIPDRDGDDIPDGEPVVMLDGWDDSAVRHNIVNGLRWGPDGWLYGRHGILATSNVGRPGATPDQRTSLNCSVWRFHPTKHTFEVVCEGTTNSWGMDWDENGELFFINTVIGHLWHAIPGSYLRRMYGEHFNPHIYEVIEQTADHFHWDTKEEWHDIRKLGVTKTTDEAGGGHAHSGMAIVPSGLWGDEYDNSVLTVNLHGRRINRDRLVREGATFVGKHAEDFMQASDPWFRGVELHFGPNGVLYIADWSDVGECHENDGVHRTSGRIYRVTPPRRSLEELAIADLSKQSLQKLLYTCQCSKDAWLVRHSLRVLAERNSVANQNRSRFSDKQLKALKQELPLWLDPETTSPSARRMTRSKYADVTINEVLAANAVGLASKKHLLKLLSTPIESIKVLAIRLLTENRQFDPDVLETFDKLAAEDESGLVLTYLCSALQKMPHGYRWPLATALGKRKEFADDRVYPLMLWYGIEPAITAYPEAAIRMAGSCQIPKVREFITRRATEELENQPQAIELLIAEADLHRNDSAFSLDVLRGINAALRGWRKAPEPKGWDDFANARAKSNNEEIRRLNRELSVVFGSGRAMDELQKIARDEASPLEERRSAIRALVLARDETIVSHLQNLLTNRDLGKDAINGLAAFGNDETPKLLVAKFGGFRDAAKREAINTLVSRVAFATVLLDAVAEQKIARDAVSAFQLRQMQSYDDDDISGRVAKLWPELAEQSQEKAKRITELRSLLSAETIAAADTSNGRLLFSRSCGNCHTLFGEGKKIAPDLTGAQRSNLNYLLENIADPSATVSKNFQMRIILLDDGRVLNGVALAQNEKTMTIQTATEQVVIQHDDVDIMRDSKLSMMPENLLNVLKDNQIRDLIGYLMSATQVPLPENAKAGPVDRLQ